MFLSVVILATNPNVGWTKWHEKTVGTGALLGLTTDGLSITHLLYSRLSHGQEVIVHLAFAPNGALLKRERIPLRFDIGRSAEIASDSVNHLHVVLFRRDYNLMYARFDGRHWSTSEIPNSLYCNSASIAADSENLPHVSCGYLYSPELHHFSFDGSSWTNELVSISSGDDKIDYYPARNPISIQGDAVHIGALAFDVTISSMVVCDNIKSSGSWSSNCGCSGSASQGTQYLTMGLDPSGLARFMYTGEKVNSTAYCELQDASSTSQTVSSQSEVGALAVDANGISNATLLEPEGSQPGPVIVQFGTLSNGIWSFETAGRGFDLYATGIALDGRGLPRVGLWGGQKHSPVRFAYKTPDRGAEP